jgi:hypothetical protein
MRSSQVSDEAVLNKVHVSSGRKDRIKHKIGENAKIRNRGKMIHKKPEVKHLVSLYF